MLGEDQSLCWPSLKPLIITALPKLERTTGHEFQTFCYRRRNLVRNMYIVSDLRIKPLHAVTV